MFKKFVISSILFSITCLSAFADNSTTRFGSLEIREKGEDEMMGNDVLYQKKPLKFDEEETGGWFSVEKIYQVKDKDVLLIKKEGGAGISCPVEFYFVTISNVGSKVSKSFGTCGDLIEAKQVPENDLISVTMSGFQGPLESESAQLKASKEKHTFIYKDGLIKEAKNKKK